MDRSTARAIAICVVSTGLATAALIAGRAIRVPPPVSYASKGVTRVAPSEPVDLTSDSVEGSHSAPVAVMVFSDFQCPFCRSFARNTMPEVRRHYVETNKVQVVFRHFPLEQIHSQARRAAEVAACLSSDDGFARIHDVLFAAPGIGEDVIAREATNAGLAPEDLARCVSGRGRAQVESDLELARRIGIVATPTVLFGRRVAGGLLEVTRRIDGAVPFAQVRTIVDELLAPSATRAGDRASLPR